MHRTALIWSPKPSPSKVLQEEPVFSEPSATSSTGVRSGINRFQTLHRDMGIDLGGLEVLVPEQLLDGP
jgi:hypothetical protein